MANFCLLERTFRRLLWHQKSKLQTNCEESKKERDEVRNKLDSMMDRVSFIFILYLQ